MKTELYLRSNELRDPYPAHKCRLIKRISSDIRDDMGVFKMIPPLPPHYYNTNSDLEFVVMASKQEGDTLFPLTKLPMQVYLCSIKVPIETLDKFLSSDQLEILDWAEIDENP